MYAYDTSAATTPMASSAWPRHSSLSTLISQTTSLMMGFCMCELPAMDTTADTKLAANYVEQRNDASSCDDPRMILKSVVRTHDMRDDDTASTASMHPLSFDTDDDDLDAIQHAVSIDEIQLDLEHGNYRDIFRPKAEGSISLNDERYRYFLGQ